jgi:biopolymer transport protein ExbB
MFDLIQNGGPVMWLIFGLSLVAATVFLQRLYYLHRAQIKTGDFLKGIFTVLARGNVVEAVSLCDETPGPVARMVKAAVLARKDGVAKVGAVMRDVGLAEVPRLERFLAILLSVAQLTPMLGLLGTVLGMMRVLLVIQQKAPLIHAGDLSGGMWLALVTTAAGLAVAIPCYAGHNLLVSLVESILLDMEQAFAEVLAFVSDRSSGKEHDDV